MGSGIIMGSFRLAGLVASFAGVAAGSGLGFTDQAASDALDMLCSMMPMVGCGLRATCENAPSASASVYCNNFNLLGEICRHDQMGGMTGCKADGDVPMYNDWCPTKTSHPECDYELVPKLPTTKEANKMNKDICTEMPGMDGCGCAGSGPECNPLIVYTKLCSTMPDMQECRQYKDMCQSVSAAETDSLRDLCYTITPGTMIMYFHNGIHDTLLFKSWTPQTRSEYAWLCIASLALGMLAHCLGVVRTACEQKIQERLRAEAESIRQGALENEKNLLLDVNQRKDSQGWQRFHLGHDLVRGLLATVHMAVAYMAMLVSMTYNTGYFICVVLGYGIGAFLFTRFITIRPTATGKLNDTVITAVQGCGCE